MIDLAISVFAIFLLVLYKVSPKSEDNSVFGFRTLFFLVTATELPYLYALNHDRKYLNPAILANVTDFDNVFVKFLFLKALFLIAFSITAFHMRKGRRRIHPPINETARIGKTASLDLELSIVMLLLTILTFALLLFDTGGLVHLLLNWSKKTEVLQGTAFYRISNLVFGALSVGFFVNFIGRKARVGILDRALLLLLISFVFLVLISVGERKNPILLVIYAMACWHFRVRPIKMLTASKILLLAAFMAFAALFPELRKDGVMEILLTDPGEVVSASLQNWGQLFARMSDVDTSLFVYSYFDSFDKFWYGATWLDLITGLIPSSLYPDKPPIDSGVYIYALAHQYNIHPPVPFRELLPVGWPLSRVTGLYVQFGILGVMFGGLITGWLMRRFSEITFESRSPGSLLVYIWAMLTGFGLTTAFVFNLASMAALLLPIHWFYRNRERKLAKQLGGAPSCS